jgi:hypothetical protein
LYRKMAAFEMSNQKLSSVDITLGIKKIRCAFALSLCLSLSFFVAVFSCGEVFTSVRDQLGIFSSVGERYSCSQHLLYILLSH